MLQQHLDNPYPISILVLTKGTYLIHKLKQLYSYSRNTISSYINAARDVFMMAIYTDCKTDGS